MNHTEINIFMAMSINGYIADENGNEDFLSNQNWQTFKDFLEKYGHVVYGRTTFDNVWSWGQNYIDTFKDKIVVVISSREIENNPENVFVCKSPVEAINLLKEKGHTKILVSGGAKTNSSFLQQNLVSKVIVNYNPVIITKGIPLFDNEYNQQVNLEINEIKKLPSNMIQIEYKVIK